MVVIAPVTAVILLYRGGAVFLTLIVNVFVAASAAGATFFVAVSVVAAVLATFVVDAAVADVPVKKNLWCSYCCYCCASRCCCCFYCCCFCCSCCCYCYCHGSSRIRLFLLLLFLMLLLWL